MTTTGGGRPTCAVIDLDNLLFNLGIIKKTVGPAAKILAAVKANAYGHGLVGISRTFEAAGIDYLGVAILEEGVELRNAGIQTPILVFGAGRPEDAGELVRCNLTQTLTDVRMAQALSAQAVRLRRAAKVHVKVDTGMGRLGFPCDKILPLLQEIKSLPGIHIEGIYSHLSSTMSSNKVYTEGQFRQFSCVLGSLAGFEIPIRHLANSMAILQFPESHLDMVRAGFILYGLYRNPGYGFKPVLTLKTAVSYVNPRPSGSPVGYGLTYRTSRKTQIAVLPIGYGDGLPRALSNQGQVLINGRRFPIAGTVCMDQTMIDVGNARVCPGMEAVLIGKQQDEEITAREIALKLNTFENEIVTRISSRVPRIFYSEAGRS